MSIVEQKIPIIITIPKNFQFYEHNKLILSEEIHMSKHVSGADTDTAGAYFNISLCQQGQGLSAVPYHQDCIKLLYVLRGSLLIEVNGNSYTVNTGDLFVILADELHTISSVSKDDTAFWEITYKRELLYAVSHSVSDINFLFSFTISGHLGTRLFTRSTLAENSISSIVECMIEEHKNAEFCSDVAIQIYLCQISLWLLRTWKMQDEERELSGINDIYSMKLLQKIFAYVDQEYMNKIKMETVANQCNMSYHSFSKFFIAHTGKTFSSYVNEVRLTKSKILLTTTGMNITEIAMEVGYISTSHFIQRFKESNQMTPQQFRKEFNK